MELKILMNLLERKISFFIAVFLLSIFFFFPLTAHAKSYSFDQLSIEAEILEDGALFIEETRTYTFHGSFSWADYKIPLKGIGAIVNFELREGDQVYSESTSENPGTYKAELREDEIYVRWFYRAKNETRRFTLRYIATDVVMAHNDIAEFYYKFVGSANLKQIDVVEISIKLPMPAKQQEVRAWAHGPPWGTIHFQEEILEMKISPLPAKRFWETRIIFPTSWVPHARNRTASDMAETIMAQEAKWAEEANEHRRRAKEIMFEKNKKESRAEKIAWILSAFGLIVVALLYFRSGRGFQVPYSQKTDPNLPEHPPAIFSSLYFDKQVRGNAMVATLFDLARRGIISIEQKDITQKKWWRSNLPNYSIKIDQLKWNKEKHKMTDYERSMLEFIFHELGKGQGTVDFRDFRKQMRKVQKWFRKWKKLIRKDIKGIALYDKESVKAFILAEIISVMVTVGGVLTLIYLGSSGMAAIIAGAVCCFLSLFILRYTPEMKLKKKKWRAFRNYLTKYHFANRTDLSWMEQIQDYLIYAVAMGAGVKPIRRLVEMIPSDKQHIYFPWYVASGSYHASPADFASAVTSMVSTATTTVSSSAGVGGGASAGGGGGAGGASGGAG